MEEQEMDRDIIIAVRGLKQYFKINESLTVKAVDGISFEIRRGEVFGLVGETGCGKSTVARVLSGIYRPAGGQVFFEGTPVSGKDASRAQIRRLQREMQIIFQDSAASLNPGMTVEQIILEPLKIQKRASSTASARESILKMLARVGMDSACLTKRPGELSGGQRQRVSIARSLMLEPKLLIADEPIASLDISIQAQIITLFQELQREKGFSFLFIAHDLSVVRFISDRTGVMLKGKLVELAPTEELFTEPRHPYTRSLLSAIHIPDPIQERAKKMIHYDNTSPLGTQFTEASPGHWVMEQ